ncbi:MAG: hypothetical protein PVI27_05870 [Desulfobacteraceae bacterium]|jgi:hypothetical protein
MGGFILIALFIIGGLALAKWLHSRDVDQMLPLLERAAEAHNGRVIQQSALGLPQLVVPAGDTTIRLTPMTKSLSAHDSGMMTCVEFGLRSYSGGEFRIQEKTTHLRKALPKLSAGDARVLKFHQEAFKNRFHVTASTVGQTAKIVSEPLLLQAILELPKGADIRIQEGMCHIAVDGMPTDVEFVHRLLAVSERMIGALKRFASKSPGN